MHNRIRKWLSRNFKSIKTFVIAFTFFIPTFLIVTNIIVIPTDTFYWMYSSIIQGFVTFLALFGMLFVFQSQMLRERHNEWRNSVLKITKNLRLTEKIYDLYEMLKELSKNEKNPFLKKVYQEFVEEHDSDQKWKKEVVSMTWNVFILVSVLIIISIFGLFITDISSFSLLNSTILVLSMTLCSAIVIQPIDFLSKMLYGKKSKITRPA